MNTSGAQSQNASMVPMSVSRYVEDFEQHELDPDYQNPPHDDPPARPKEDTAFGDNPQFEADLGCAAAAGGGGDAADEDRSQQQRDGRCPPLGIDVPTPETYQSATAHLTKVVPPLNTARAASHTRKMRLRDQILFLAGVANVMALSVFTGGYHHVLPIFYTIKFPLLVGFRFYAYHRKRHIYFLLDLCYFCNGLLLLYLWAFPGEERLFTVVYALAHGPLAWAVCLFGNSIVFHSADKMTSCFIHVSPLLVTFCVRWFSDEIHDVTSFQDYDVCDKNDSCSNFLWTAIAPLLFVIAHSLFYVVAIKVICPLPADKSYLTTYRYLSRPGGPAHMFRRMKCGTILYACANITLNFMMLSVTILFYKSFTANCLFISLVIAMAVWNGGGYYIHVFGRKYEGWHTKSGRAIVTKSKIPQPPSTAPPGALAASDPPQAAGATQIV